MREKELKEIQERIAGCYVAILNYAIGHIYSYKRWKQILNCMIYKELGNVRIHQLQVIYIYEVGDDCCTEPEMVECYWLKYP